MATERIAAAEVPVCIAVELDRLDREEKILRFLTPFARDIEDFVAAHPECQAGPPRIYDFEGKSIALSVYAAPDVAIRFFASLGYKLKGEPKKNTTDTGLGWVEWDFGEVKLTLWLSTLAKEGIKCRVVKTGEREVMVKRATYEIVCDEPAPAEVTG